MLWRLSKKFQFAADRFIPDSFVFCVILTLVAFVMPLFLEGNTPISLVEGWYNGLWTMISFAFQMIIMVVACTASAKSPFISKLLIKLSSLPKTPAVAYAALLLFGAAASLINWAFSVIVTPILAMYLSKNVRGMHFPLMIAAGYSMMLAGQNWSPVASIIALTSTPGHFLEDKIGIMTQDVTVYNEVNTILFFASVLMILLLCIYTRPPQDEVIEYDGEITKGLVIKEDISAEKTPADYMNGSRLLMWIIGLAGIIVISRSFMLKGVFGSLNLNFVIFLFITMNCFLYNSPTKFLGAYRESMSTATDSYDSVSVLWRYHGYDGSFTMPFFKCH